MPNKELQAIIKGESWDDFQKKLELLGELIEKEAPKKVIFNLWDLTFINSEILRREVEKN